MVLRMMSSSRRGPIMTFTFFLVAGVFFRGVREQHLQGQHASFDFAMDQGHGWLASFILPSMHLYWRKSPSLRSAQR